MRLIRATIFSLGSLNYATVNGTLNVFGTNGMSLAFTNGGSVSASGATINTTCNGVGYNSFTLTSGTTTYSVAPTITITPGVTTVNGILTQTGSGATAAAQLNSAGLVIGVQITNPGSGYLVAPIFTVSGGTVLAGGTNPTIAGAATFANGNTTLNGAFTGSGGNGLTKTGGPTPLTISLATEAAFTPTITTATAHNLQIGQQVTISGVSVSGYNGTYTVLSIPSATTFTYTAPTSFMASSGLSGTATPIVQGSLTFNGTSGVSPNTMPLTINAGAFNLNGQLGDGLVTIANAGTTATFNGRSASVNGNVTVSNGASLVIDSTSGTTPGQVANTLTLSGGSLTVNAPAGATRAENINTLILGGGANTLSLTPGSGTSAAQLTLANVISRPTGGTLTFNRNATNGGSSANLFIGAPNTPANGTPETFVLVNEPTRSGGGSYSTSLGIIAPTGIVYSSIASGSWAGGNAVWNGQAGVPGAGDIVIINSGHNITLDGARQCAQLTFNPIVPLTPLSFNSSQPMSLSSGTGGPNTLTCPSVTMTGQPTGGWKGDYYTSPAANGATIGTQTGSKIETIAFQSGNTGPNSWPLNNNVGLFVGLNSNITASVTNQVGAVWNGYFEPQYTDTYTFYNNSDDGTTVTVNGVPIINRFGIGQAIGNDDTGTIALTAGVRVPVNIQWSQGTGGLGIVIGYSSSTIAKQILPASAMIPDANAVLSCNLNMGGATATVSNLGTGVLTISGALSNATDLAVATSTSLGAIELSGTNTNTGTTTVAGGILRADTQAPNSATGTSSVTVNAGATLAGNGNIAGAVTVANASNAVVNPGITGTGTLTLAGGLTTGASTSLRADLALSGAPGTSDNINMGSNSISLNGAWTFVPGLGFGAGTYNLVTSTGGISDSSTLPTLGLLHAFEGGGGQQPGADGQRRHGRHGKLHVECGRRNWNAEQFQSADLEHRRQLAHRRPSRNPRAGQQHDADFRQFWAGGILCVQQSGFAVRRERDSVVQRDRGAKRAWVARQSGGQQHGGQSDDHRQRRQHASLQSDPPDCDLVPVDYSRHGHRHDQLWHY